MQKKPFLTALFASCVLLLSAQDNFKFGLRGGVSTTDIEANELVIIDNTAMEELGLAIEEANYGYHFGLFAQFKGEKFFLQPEVLFNSNNVDFRLTNRTTGELIPEILTEQYQYLDIPVMAGVKFGPLRLQGGPVGHVFIDSKSDLVRINEYSENFEDLTFGWQAGLGLDFWKFVVDLKYEGNFNNFGDHIVIGGQQYAFDRSPTRIVASLGIAF